MNGMEGQGEKPVSADQLGAMGVQRYDYGGEAAVVPPKKA